MNNSKTAKDQNDKNGLSPNDPVDLLIIGGGINGVAVARDAAGRGLSVVLCEKGDLAEGTSSRSGKYIHGGLRYLEHYEFRLVRKALQEREVVLEIAPHLAKPLQLILPHSPEQRPRWLIKAGLLLYDNLSRRKRVPKSGSISLRNNPVGEKVRDDFKNAFSYWDVWVDDARLVTINAVDASRMGAQILTRTECASAKRVGNIWQAALKSHNSQQTSTVYAKAVFNAAGPWVKNVIEKVFGLRSDLNIRLVKGSHIILPKWWKGNHGYALQGHDKRLIFVNQYFENMALVGTTEIPFEEQPEDVNADASEIEYLLKILMRYFQIDLNPDNLISKYSGVRPLFDDDDGKSATTVTRDYEFELDGSLAQNSNTPPMLSVFGGKLTTFRKLSENALERLSPYFPGMKDPWTSDIPLPGGDSPNWDFETWSAKFKDEYSGLPIPFLQHLVANYGSEAPLLLDDSRKQSDLGTHFGGNLYEIEAEWLIRNEWAQTSEDILFRRTKHGLFINQQERENFESWMNSKQIKQVSLMDNPPSTENA